MAQSMTPGIDWENAQLAITRNLDWASNQLSLASSQLAVASTLDWVPAQSTILASFPTQLVVQNKENVGNTLAVNQEKLESNPLLEGFTVPRGNADQGQSLEAILDRLHQEQAQTLPPQLPTLKLGGRFPLRSAAAPREPAQDEIESPKIKPAFLYGSQGFFPGSPTAVSDALPRPANLEFFEQEYLRRLQKQPCYRVPDMMPAALSTDIEVVDMDEWLASKEQVLTPRSHQVPTPKGTLAVPELTGTPKSIRNAGGEKEPRHVSFNEGSVLSMDVPSGRSEDVLWHLIPEPTKPAPRRPPISKKYKRRAELELDDLTGTYSGTDGSNMSSPVSGSSFQPGFGFGRR